MKNFPDNIEELYKTLKSYPELKNKQCRASFDGYFKSIEQIHSFNKETKYKIVFIGEPGRGKTTAICNWLSLLKTEKIDQPNIDSISLLAASSGRSTVAEVHIKQVSTKSRIYIEYMPKDIQQEYIKEYCNSYYTQALDIKDETDCLDSEENAELQHHSEIDRVIFNMAQPILEKIPSNILADEESIKTKEKIKKDISEFKNQSEFYQFILDIIDIDNRKLQEIFLPPNENFENWLRNNFYDINNGNNKQCSIPNKIYIDINIDDLNMELPDYVCEIIDTMGLDSNVRPDLQELLKADDTICFIMDELTKVPSQNIVSLINSSLQNDWDKKYCPNKISIFVRASDETLSAVMDAEGDAEKGNESARTWPQTDILKSGHHGSSTSSSQKFLDQVKPKIGII
ncbi:MAG: hypothetical protein MJ234_00335, partial [bacterium]|nr:hypothetical protein [bacterium]